MGQRIMVQETELDDESVVSVETVTLIRKEVPMILTQQFLESMVDCVENFDDQKIFKKWHGFDTYERFPEDKDKLLEWAMRHREMQHFPLTRDHVLKSLDPWLNLQPDSGVSHPESFQKEVDGLIAFFKNYCHSPSLLQVYEGPYEN